MKARWLALVAAPPALVAAWAIAQGQRAAPSDSAGRAWLALGVSLVLSAVLAWTVESRLRRRLGTVVSVLSAYREGDFSIRARDKNEDRAVHEVLAELNQLGELLRTHRLGEMEAWALLHKVMAEVDAVVVAIDDEGVVRLANDAAARLLGRPSRKLVGERGAALGLEDLVAGDAPRIVRQPIGTNAGPWELRRGAFRLAGEPHTLLVLSDVSRALRENERDAWRRLIRVMGHEINNSLSPIKSISESLVAFADPSKREEDWERDLEDGLSVIARRSEALGRFMASYAKLARLPSPRPVAVHVETLVRKIASLETRLAVAVEDGPDLTVSADPDQLEQALINLVKNAAEASLSRGAATTGVRIRWALDDRSFVLSVEDDGPGVDDTANLFVPFFTTKPEGSGVGLVLSRQIIEAHDGQLALSTRTDAPGAIARIRLPLNKT